MEIRVGKYILCSDQYSMWINEEYIPKKKDGTPGKPTTRKVAGYATDINRLFEQFVAHKHMASEAQTVEELVKVMKETAEDTILLRKTAVANDLKIMRKVGKAVKEINQKGAK